MTDIFLSYASEDRERVRPIVNYLREAGWSVWWDRSVIPGNLGATGVICRGVRDNSKGVSEIARFSSGSQGEKFGIEFKLVHPCSQAADPLKLPNAKTKTCTMVGDTGKVWEVIKYDVIGTDNCPDKKRRVLDPYLILVR